MLEGQVSSLHNIEEGVHTTRNKLITNKQQVLHVHLLTFNELEGLPAVLRKSSVGYYTACDDITGHCFY